MDPVPLKLGLAPTRRNVFSVEDSLRYKSLVQAKLTEWGVDFVNIDSVNEEGLLYGAEDAAKAARLFRDEGVGALFCPHCNFGTEDAVAKLAKSVGVPLLLWGPRDEAPETDGSRLRDTQCGLFATSKVLRRFGIPFSYIVNSRVDSAVFERGVRVFLQAARAARAFLECRIGSVSTRPGGFWTMIVNEGELLERFGIQVVPTTLLDIAAGVEKRLGDKDVKRQVERLREVFGEPADSDADLLPKLAALYVVLREWADEERLGGIGIQCWTAMQEHLGISPCIVNGLLTGEGVPVSCETDIHGAATSVLLQAAAGAATPTFFADLTIRHPSDDNAELLWHCGPFPPELAAEGQRVSLCRHYIIAHAGYGCGEFRIKGGPVTIARFDGDGGDYRLMFGQGEGTDGPVTRGTYVWLKVPDWPLWEERIIRGPYVHHVSGVHGWYSAALREACRFIPGLSADPIQPSEAEIGAWLRGGDVS